MTRDLTIGVIGVCVGFLLGLPFLDLADRVPAPVPCYGQPAPSDPESLFWDLLLRDPVVTSAEPEASFSSVR